MILSISHWFTNQKIAMIAASMACVGFIGPGLFDLSPPRYFASKSIVVEHGNSAQDSKILPMLSGDRSAASSSSEIKKMTGPLKSSGITELGLSNDLEIVRPKRQKDIPDIDKKSSKFSPLENVKTGKAAHLSELTKSEKLAKNLKGPNNVGVEVKPTLQAVRAAPLLMPREFVEQIPTSHQSLSGSAQKASFFKITLPLILAGNEEVISRRAAIGRASQNNDRNNLEKWAHLYDIKITDQDNNTLTRQLLSRVDVIPVPIALAQAAVESGWGTSRFAIKGNALFGQWAWRDDAGLRPLTPTNDRAVVRSFGTLFGSVRAYIHNLNTHSYYQNFRNARAALYDGPEEIKTKVLVKHLDRYAEIGPVYVTKLEDLIRTNNLGRYALAYLY